MDTFLNAAIATADGAYREALEVAIELAVRAGEVIAGYHGRALEVDLKLDDEPVTAADRASSALITAELAARFPDDIVISEESADDLRRMTAPRVWYIDPIDGTADFIRGELGFCVMIGLVEGGRPTLGVVHQPIEKLTYFAAPGAGAFAVRGKAAPVPLAVSDVTELAELRLVVSRSHRDETLEAIKGALGTKHERGIGSVGLKLGAIADCAADLYVTGTNKCSSWDTAAPAAILAEAGGILTDTRGVPLRYDQRSVSHERGLLATNRAVHSEVVRTLAPIFASFSL